MNLESKARYLTDEHRARMRALTESEYFLRAVEVALLEVQSNFMTNGSQVPSATHFRMEGAHEVIRALLNLAEPTPRINPPTAIKNLDHKY